MYEKLQAFSRLLTIMDELRAKCPWDREQTFDSLRTLTIEETYELADAIANNDLPNIKKELGDVLLHIVFYAKLGDEAGAFDIKEVINALCDKLIYRHPHVYGETTVNNANQVIENWEQLKLKEKDGNKRVLSGIPVSLPAMIKAYRVQDKVRAVGFDWDDRSQVWDKVTEELNELKVELEKGDKEKSEQELGDLLFSVVNAARLYDINPEDALERTNRKFMKRFSFLEERAIQLGKSLKDMTLGEMDVIWEEAKKFDKV
jgi:XTP/dITP diphosphohydrolase